MISRADALEVMAIVTACHRRTGPRLDDRDVARATADTWAKLFNVHHLELPDLVAAVEKRATSEREAPEPAEIIQIARAIRRQRDADAGPTPEYEALCESKAADADELAELRRARDLAPALPRHELKPLIAGIANRKTLPREQIQP